MRSIVTLIISISLLIPASGQSKWEIVNEGFALEFESVDFINRDTGWIAGEKGLFKTTDGGESWEIVCDKTEIHEIDFYNDSMGWAFERKEVNSITYNNNILKTLDGGKTWIFQVSTTRSLQDLIIVSGDIVYAIDFVSIIKTIDGGSHWEDITPLASTNFRYASFCNADTGIVVGENDGFNEDVAIIFKTFNGGESWVKQTTTFSHIGKIKLKNDSVAYFIARDDLDSVSIYTTSNLFESWNVINPPGDRIYSCHFFGDDTIIALVGAGGAGFDPGSMSNLKSIDGGSTWNHTDHMKLINIGGLYPTKMYVVEDVAYLFAFNPSSYGGGHMNFILKSTDQGNHWPCMNLTFPMCDVHFINQDKGLIAVKWSGFHTQEGYLLTTQNGGETWNTDFDPGFLPKKIHFLNDTIGYILGDWSGGDVHFTTDGGENWVLDEYLRGSDLYSLNDSISLRLVSPLGYNDSVLIQKTMNGGESWQTIYKFGRYFNHISEYALDCKSLFFLDENIGYAVGEGGLIIKFSEQGVWETIESGTTLPLNKVLFVDKKFGLIAGGYSNDEDFLPIMLVTDDGGDHWSEGTDIPYLIHDMHFLDSQHGFAVGEDAERHGVLLETIDRGSSWSKISLGKNLSGPLRALHFKDGIGWAVGDNSLILKYVSSGTSNQEYAIIKNESVFQNHPNPFQSKTIISYQLQATTDVELSIFDLSGRKVTTILNESKASGKHEHEWNASGLSPGIYICELKTAQGRQVIKMILID